MRPFLSHSALAALMILSVSAAGCGTTAPTSGLARTSASQAALGATPIQPMRPALEALVDRSFRDMSGAQGAPVGADVLGRYLQLSAGDAAQAVKAMDRDGDRLVSHDELLTWAMRIPGLMALRDAVIAPAFSAADSAGDGRLTPAEAGAATLALGAQGSWALKIDAADFALADFDHDGTLSQVEFSAIAAHKIALAMPTDPVLPQTLARFWYKAASAS